jgi:hypothetical protein
MPYYFNRDTSESIWEPPTGTDMAALQTYLTANFTPSNSQNEKIRVRHLLVKHSQSRRPSSWKEVNTPQYQINGVGENHTFTRRSTKDLGITSSTNHFRIGIIG